jgi:hypothetical protein
MRRKLRRVVTRAGPIGLFLAVLFVGNGFGLFGSTSGPVNQTAAISAAPQPTATYVSELGPAVMLPPRQVGELPSSGTGIGATTPWPKAAGLGLALLGSLLIHAALTLRPQGTR